MENQSSSGKDKCMKTGQGAIATVEARADGSRYGDGVTFNTTKGTNRKV